MVYREKIITFLQKSAPRKYSTAQLIYILSSQGLSESVIFAALKKMREQKDVKWEWCDNLNGNSRPCRQYWTENREED